MPQPMTRPICTPIGTVVLLVMSSWATNARADDTHYQDFVVGDRAVVLGGAFTSIANDASGVYFNPAGLSDISHTSLQLSASLYGYERNGYQDRGLGFLGVPDVEKLEVAFTDLIIVPASAGFARALGEPGPDGLPVQAYGFSVLVPSFRSSSFSASTDDNAIHQRRVTDRELWAGAGYGRKFGKQLRLGVSAFYVLRSVSDLEEVTEHKHISDTLGDAFTSMVNDISLTNGSLVFIAGAKYKINDNISLGAALQSPSVQLHSTASLRFSRASADPTVTDEPVSTFDPLTLSDATSETRQPAALRLGASYQRPYRYTLSADVSVHAPVDYTLVQVSDSYRARLPFNPNIERRLVANINVGAEYLVVREVSIALGVYSDFSSAPSIPANPTTDQPPNVHLLGLTMALGYFGEHSLSRLGFIYSFGNGYDVVPKSDIRRALDEAQEFDRVAYSQSFFYVFLSSTFRY